MLRSDYIDNYRKIKLKNKQIKDISEFIERYMLLGSRHCSESCGWVDTFNDFYWYSGFFNRYCFSFCQD